MEQLFGVVCQGLKLGIGIFRLYELNKLDLVELVLTDEASRVAAGRTRLGAETGRKGPATNKNTYLISFIGFRPEIYIM